MTGIIKDLVPYKRIVQAWRFSSWPEGGMVDSTVSLVCMYAWVDVGHYSNVNIDLSEGEGKTVLTLQHTDVPDSDLERTRVSGVWLWYASSWLILYLIEWMVKASV